MIARCRHCGNQTHLIDGDGPLVCRVCVYRFGDAAGRPELLSQGEALLLKIAHSDVVTLGTDGRRWFWCWSKDWPGKPERQVVHVKVERAA